MLLVLIVFWIVALGLLFWTFRNPGFRKSREILGEYDSHRDGGKNR